MHKRHCQPVTWNKLLLVCIIIVIGVLGYSNTFHSSFHFDDFAFILSNPPVQDITDVDRWSQFLSTHNRTRVIGFLSFAINYYFHQDSVFAYHATNLFIHLGSALMVFWLFLLIFEITVLKDSAMARHKAIIALFAALIFVSHPLQTQAVTYIYQRLASLAAFFYLAALNFYLQGRLNSKNQRQSIIFYFGSTILAVLGMFTKEIVFTLPITIFMCEYYFAKPATGTTDGIKERCIKFIPLLLLLIIPLVLMFDFSFVFAPRVLRAGQHELITSQIYLLTQFNVIVKYIQLLIIPIGQNLDYDFPLSYSLFGGTTFLSFVVLLAILWTGFKTYRKHPLVSMGIFWFFITISIESSIIPIRYVIWEHRLYLPMVGFCMILVGVIYAAFNNIKKFSVILCIVVLILTVLTYKRNMVWKNEITLWSDVVKKSPAKPYAHFALGTAYQNAGLLNEAFMSYKKTLSFYSRDQKYKDIGLMSQIFTNLGQLFEVTGQQQKAQEARAEAARYREEFAAEYHKLGKRLYDKGRIHKAVRLYKRATVYGKNEPIYYFDLGVAYQKLGLLPESIKSFKKASTLYSDRQNKQKVSEIRSIINSMQQ